MTYTISLIIIECEDIFYSLSDMGLGYNCDIDCGNNCTMIVCDNGSLNSGYTACDCPAGTGWEGTTCGTCNSHWVADGYCDTCATGYEGADCDICSDGYHNDGSGNCVEDAACVNGTLSADGSSCECLDGTGWEGSLCETCDDNWIDDGLCDLCIDGYVRGAMVRINGGSIWYMSAGSVKIDDGAQFCVKDNDGSKIDFHYSQGDKGGGGRNEYFGARVWTDKDRTMTYSEDMSSSDRVSWSYRDGC